MKIKKIFLADILRYQREDATVLETLLESDALEPWQIGKLKALQTHFSKLPGLESFAAIQRIVRFMGYGDYLSEQRADMTKLNILLALANQNRETAGLLLRLADLKKIVEREDTPDCPLILSTIHSSKGLEYERVILIDVTDGIFSSVAEATDGKELPPEDLEALEEERRLFYVGVTRAKKQVELLRYERQFGESSATASTFITQLLGIEPEPVPVAAPKLPAYNPGPTAEQISDWEKDYIPGAEVTHAKFGRGLFMSRTGNIAVISFRELGVKKVDLAACLKKDLIRLTYFV